MEPLIPYKSPAGTEPGDRPQLHISISLGAAGCIRFSCSAA